MHSWEVRPDAPKMAMLAWRAVVDVVVVLLLLLRGCLLLLLAMKAEVLPARRAVAKAVNFMVAV